MSQSHYIVDAYNLLFWCLEGQNLERERALLIREVNNHSKRRHLHVTLVFDATWTDDPLVRGHFDALEIIFTAKGVTADDHILSMVQEKEGKNMVVVTSDRALSRGAGLLGAKTLTTPAFFKGLQKKSKEERKAPLKEQVYFPPPKPFITEGSIAWYLQVFEERSKKPKN